MEPLEIRPYALNKNKTVEIDDECAEREITHWNGVINFERKKIKDANERITFAREQISSLKAEIDDRATSAEAQGEYEWIPA